MHLAYLAPNRKTCQQLHHLFFVTDQMLFLMQNSVKALKASEHYKQLLSLSCSDYICKWKNLLKLEHLMTVKQLQNWQHIHTHSYQKMKQRKEQKIRKKERKGKWKKGREEWEETRVEGKRREGNKRGKSEMCMQKTKKEWYIHAKMAELLLQLQYQASKLIQWLSHRLSTWFTTIARPCGRRSTQWLKTGTASRDTRVWRGASTQLGVVWLHQRKHFLEVCCQRVTAASWLQHDHP